MVSLKLYLSGVKDTTVGLASSKGNGETMYQNVALKVSNRPIGVHIAEAAEVALTDTAI